MISADLAEVKGHSRCHTTNYAISLFLSFSSFGCMQALHVWTQDADAWWVPVEQYIKLEVPTQTHVGGRQFKDRLCWAACMLQSSCTNESMVRYLQRQTPQFDYSASDLQTNFYCEWICLSHPPHPPQGCSSIKQEHILMTTEVGGEQGKGERETSPNDNILRSYTLTKGSLAATAIW